MTVMEELSMKETLKAGDERKVEEDFFQYIVIRLGYESTVSISDTLTIL